MPAAGTKRTAKQKEAEQTEVIKKQKENAAKIRLLISGRYTGALIGKGGENFKKLREQYSVKITGLSSRANERVLQLDGDREDCISIVEEVLPSCPESPYPAQSQRCAIELNLLVNTEQVGSIIGKGGSKIREISESSGAKLNVIADCLPNSNERVVSIGGDDESEVISGLNTVLDILDTYPMKTQTIYFKPNDGAVSHGLTTVASSNNTASEVNVAEILMANRDHNKQNPRDVNTDFGLVQTVTTLSVPNDMCGAIIGKGGSNLRQIFFASGVKVDCAKSSPGSKEDRTITLTGTQEQIQIAQQVMSQLCQK